MIVDTIISKQIDDINSCLICEPVIKCPAYDKKAVRKIPAPITIIKIPNKSNISMLLFFELFINPLKISSDIFLT